MPIIDSRVKVRPKEEEQEKGSGRTFHKRIYQAKIPWKETRKDLRLFGSLPRTVSRSWNPWKIIGGSKILDSRNCSWWIVRQPLAKKKKDKIIEPPTADANMDFGRAND